MIHTQEGNILSINSSEKINIENNIQGESKDKNETKQEKKLDPNEIEEVPSNKPAHVDEVINYNEEVSILLRKKKVGLQKKFEGLVNKFKTSGDIGINELVENYHYEYKNLPQQDDEFEENQNDKNEIKNQKKIFLNKRGCKIYIWAFLFLVFYLVGIFQLLDLFDSTKKETGIIFKSFFYHKEREDKESFIDLYINSCFKNIPEFDFAFVTSFLGTFPLNFLGFFLSSVLFTILNSFLFLNFITLDLEKKYYDFFDFYHISIYFVLFFISFGVISLFPHEKISEGILYYGTLKEKYDEKTEMKNAENKKKENKETNVIQITTEENVNKEEKEKEKEKQNKKSKTKNELYLFFVISLGIIFAYVINKAANFAFYQYTDLFKKKFHYVFLLIYVGSYILSLIFYLLFHYQILVLKEIENIEEDEEKAKSGFYKVCGFLMFYEKVPIDNRNEEEKNKEKENKKEEQKKRNEKIKKGKINELINCRDIFCLAVIPFYKACRKKNKNAKFYCASCKLGCRKFYNKATEGNLGLICCCTCCKCQNWCCPSCNCDKYCCVCCAQLKDLRESYEEEEVFCYVYKTQRKCSWFCDICFQNNIISLIIYNIAIEIIIIGFEKKLNENLETKSIFGNFISISVYLGFFFIFIFSYTCFCFKSLEDKNLKCYSIFVIIFFGFNIALTAISIFFKNKIKKFIIDWLSIIPLANTKYINFLLLEKLVGLLDEENIDILSNSLIMTSVFFVYDIIVFLVTDMANFNSDDLIRFQFVIGIIILIFMILNIIISSKNWSKSQIA